jgi:hypothetical protein
MRGSQKVLLDENREPLNVNIVKERQLELIEPREKAKELIYQILMDKMEHQKSCSQQIKVNKKNRTVIEAADIKGQQQMNDRQGELFRAFVESSNLLIK